MGEVCHDGTHERRCRAVACALLEVVELSREVARRSAGERRDVVLALQVRTMATGARGRLALDDLVVDDHRAARRHQFASPREAADRCVGDETYVWVANQFGLLLVTRDL